MAELDKFYTNHDVALWLKERTFALFGPTLPEKKLEPSAGAGAFLEDRDGVVAFDLLPHHWRATEMDSVAPDIPYIMNWVMEDWPKKELLTIGNPPFGIRGDLASKFINLYLQVGGLVAFVLPVVFRKWAGQKQIDQSARLVADWDLPANTFHTPDGKPYALDCCFQIWSTREADRRFEDLRLSEPVKHHPDFDMWTATGAEHAGWAKEWDFAAFCQGGGRYGERFDPGYRPTNSRRHMLFKARTPTALARLRQIDFAELAMGWAPVRGFGAAEVVEAYKLKDDDVLIQHGTRSRRRAS